MAAAAGHTHVRLPKPPAKPRRRLAASHGVALANNRRRRQFVARCSAFPRDVGMAGLVGGFLADFPGTEEGMETNMR